MAQLRTLRTDPLCLGSDKVIQFAKDVFKEVFDLFPYSYAEIGGDEVSRKKWEGCPLCQERIRRENLGGLEELQSWFTKEMEKFFNANGRRLIGWDEILEGEVLRRRRSSTGGRAITPM